MIIVKLHGGLGNQLFQYSLGRNLAIKNNTKLKLDLRIFEIYKLHKYSLNYFNISAEIATNTEIRQYKQYKHSFTDKIYNFFSNHQEKIIKEQFFNFSREVLNSPNDTYLEGYWQSEKYFKEIESTIKKDITLKPELNPSDNKIIETIKKTNSISLHIRRADYIANAKTNAVHGTCSIEYYKKAIEILQKINDISLFIFSDDIDWAKQNIQFPYPCQFIDHGAEKNYLDLFLMSQCRHNIIANSSFSWWGAWLNNNPDKIIIAPQKWFNDPSKNIKDLIPESWIKI